MTFSRNKYSHLSHSELLKEAQAKEDAGILVPIAQALATRMENGMSNIRDETEKELQALKSTYEIQD